MKTIGLLGGMSWESTIPYYRLINEGVKQRLGGLHSASLLLHSVDFHDIEACQSRGEWDKAGEMLAEAALGLERAGAVRYRSCTLPTRPGGRLPLRGCRAWRCWARAIPWSRISTGAA